MTSVIDGTFHGPMREQTANDPVLTMIEYWMIDLRYAFEQGILASTVLFVGSRFLETRAVLTIGFGQEDGSKLVTRGPDENNVVWIGRRYDSPHEAQAVAGELERKLGANVVDDQPST